MIVAVPVVHMANLFPGGDAKTTERKRWSWLGRVFTQRLLALDAFLLSAAVMFMYRPFTRMESGDPAIYDYIAQSILRGQIPYRDIVDIKGPGSVYLSAMAMAIGNALGVRDIIANRVMHILLVGVLSAVIYLVAEAYLRSRIAAFIAVLIPLMFEPCAAWMIEGGQPKLPMILFGMTALLMIARDKPAWAGFCSMLSCLCWQPGLLFTGVALLIFSRYLTSWRDGRAVRVVAGAAAPLLIVLGYFYWKGALGDLWAWTITYNYSVFGPDARKPLVAALLHLWQGLHRLSIPVVWVALAGLLMFVFERVRVRVKRSETLRSADLFRDALLIPPLVYFAFTLINFQGGPDLIPFIPFIAIFGAWAFVAPAHLLTSVRSRKAGRYLFSLAGAVPGLALTMILILVPYRAEKFRLEGPDLEYQDQVMKTVAGFLGPEDKVYVHGSPEILVLLKRPNLNPYIFLDWGADDFAAERRGIRFEAIIEEIEAQSPRIVTISRLKNVSRREDFKKWVAAHYDKLDLSKDYPEYARTHDPIYIRRTRQ